MKGTIIAQKRAMRWMPPKMMASVSKASPPATYCMGTWKELLSASHSVLLCTIWFESPKP